MPVSSHMTAGSVGGFVPGLTPAGLPFPASPLANPGESTQNQVSTVNFEECVKKLCIGAPNVVK